MHGGKSTGPKTAEGRERIRQAALKHGRYTAENVAKRRELREHLRACREFIRTMRRAL
jgi:hypothetical protein